MAKREKMLEGIDLQRDRGIEIGALASPLVTKAEADIRYIDWTDQQALVAKYSNDPNVDTAKIVPVDAIWGDLSLKESLRGESGFGYAIASPAFGAGYSDDDIAAVANYVTARFGAQGAQLTGSDVATLRQQTTQQPHPPETPNG